jgi:predicted nucleic acid-binding OB-fold protein
LNAVVEVDYDNDRKKKINSKEDMKEKIWRSPDRWDVMSMRFYFELKNDDKYKIFV